MQFLLHPSQGRMARFALADASQRSTGWRKWILVLKPGFDSTPLFIYLFFGWFWEPGPLNRRGRLFSFSPVAPHACSPSGCLFFLLNISHFFLFCHVPWHLLYVFALEYSNSLLLVFLVWSGEPFLISIISKNGWSPFSRQLQSPISLLPYQTTYLIVVSICLNFILCVLRPITGPDTLPALSKCVWVSTWQNQCRIHHQPLLHTSSLARYPW